MDKQRSPHRPRRPDIRMRRPLPGTRHVLLRNVPEETLAIIESAAEIAGVSVAAYIIAMLNDAAGTALVLSPPSEHTPANHRLLPLPPVRAGRFIGEVRHAPGVYLIMDHVSGECYIGQSADLRKRILRHHGMLLRGLHGDCPKMQTACNRDGIDAFTFEVLYYVSDDDIVRLGPTLRAHLEEAERHFMRFYSCDFNTNKGNEFDHLRVSEDIA